MIYGFNNGGNVGFLDATLLAEDGTFLGGHICSYEFYMPGDLGILEGSRPDRHETFKKHYPAGYRMDFVPYDEVRAHSGLMAAIEKAAARTRSTEQEGEAVSVQIAFGPALVGEIEMSMTITMKVREWKEFQQLIGSAHPGWKVSSEISRLVEMAERNFGSFIEAEDALATVREGQPK